ncbi:MAG: hypothetical protein ACR2MC_12695 [Actinomycetota bacterium]
MPYACFYDVPGDERMYAQVKAEIGKEQPKGLILHMVLKREDGLRHFEVWESRQEWERFQQERVAPAVAKMLAAVGVTEPPPRPEAQEMELVDLTTGT